MAIPLWMGGGWSLRAGCRGIAASRGLVGGEVCRGLRACDFFLHPPPSTGASVHRNPSRATASSNARVRSTTSAGWVVEHPRSIGEAQRVVNRTPTFASPPSPPQRSNVGVRSVPLRGLAIERRRSTVDPLDMPRRTRVFERQGRGGRGSHADVRVVRGAIASVVRRGSVLLPSAPQ